MNKVKLQEKAKKIIALEKQCQQGVDIEKNIEEMEKIMASLTFDEMLTLADYLDDIDLQN